MDNASLHEISSTTSGIVIFKTAFCVFFVAKWRLVIVQWSVTGRPPALWPKATASAFGRTRTGVPRQVVYRQYLRHFVYRHFVYSRCLFAQSSPPLLRRRLSSVGRLRSLPPSLRLVKFPSPPPFSLDLVKSPLRSPIANAWEIRAEVPS